MSDKYPGAKLFERSQPETIRRKTQPIFQPLSLKHLSKAYNDYAYRRQDLFRDSEGIQELVVPGQSGQVEEQSPARVGDVRHVSLAYEGIRERERVCSQVNIGWR